MSIGCVATLIWWCDLKGNEGRGQGEQASSAVWQLVDATYGYLLAVGSVSERRGQS